MTLDIALAVISGALCVWRAVAAIRAKRISAIFWMLIAYFSLFFIPVAATEELRIWRGFLSEAIRVPHSVIHKAMLYVLAFNILLAATDIVVALIFRNQRASVSPWEHDASARGWTLVQNVLWAYWLVGGSWYLWQTKGWSYTSYVEGTSWAAVFLWASSPLIVLLSLQRRWALAFMACVPFLYCALHLAVRSFALLSIVPLMVVGFYQVLSRQGAGFMSRHLVRYIVLAGGTLTALSIGISQFKNKLITLPDSYMPFGVAQVMAMTDRLHESTGFSSLQLYGWNYISPFARLFGSSKPHIVDTPAIIARMLEGVPPDWPAYFHYPALIWSDAYLSFGWWGLVLAPLWMLVIALWEFGMRRSQRMLVLLLPYFTWHCYMLARGAVAIASVPVSYALYFSAMPMLIAFGIGILKKGRTTGHPTRITYSQSAARRPANLLD